MNHFGTSKMMAIVDVESWKISNLNEVECVDDIPANCSPAKCTVADALSCS